MVFRSQPLTSVTTFAARSALLSAARSLLETFDTTVIRNGPASTQADNALRKAALHVAQVRLLRSGRYASDLETALARLRGMASAESCEASAADLSFGLMSGLMADDGVEGFLRLRQCILEQMADIGAAPFSLPIVKSIVRNAQYAAVAHLRGRNRWRLALSRTPVEAALAAMQLALLRALDPRSENGLDATQLHVALEVCPVPLGAPGSRSWEEMRDLALAEWLDAHPLVGLLA